MSIRRRSSGWFSVARHPDLHKIQWIIPFSLVMIFGIMLSVRELSDPDLGFHLKYGKWIVENLTVPDHDLSTYTVPGNEYIDSHWLFQVLLYLTFKTTGYHGISILIAILAGTIFILYLWRIRIFDIPPLLTLILFLSALILLEPRILPRPEMFTYIFLLSTLLILESYYEGKKNLLFLLPFLLLAWSNIHGLFMFGLFVILAYTISCGIRNRTPDLKMIITLLLSVGACFLNPYFAKGVFFPFQLLSRFTSDNIYHQHIAEFRSIFELDHQTGVQTSFLIVAGIFIIIWVGTIRKRPVHELILVPISLYLLLVAVRNIPLFALTCIPFIAGSLKDISRFTTMISRDGINKSLYLQSVKSIVYVFLILMPLLNIIRVLNGRFYSSNHLNCRAGMGINRYQIPEDASRFLLNNGLNGRILNSLGIGGWLSWQISQPVFIDGRLEVMKEELYKELMKSWDNGLPGLVEKYQPSIIIFNYLKYYPWTTQLSNMHDWRLVYLDGLFAIYLLEGYATRVPPLATDQVMLQFGLHHREKYSDQNTFRTMHSSPFNKVVQWLKGDQNDSTAMLQNAGMFYLQAANLDAAKMLMSEVYNRTHGESEIALKTLDQLQRISRSRLLESPLENKECMQSGISLSNKDAILNFNLGNEKLKQGDIKAAIGFYSKSIQINPEYYKAFLNRAYAYARIEHYSEALADFDSAIDINPSLGEAYLGKGSCYHFLGIKEKACKYWNQAYSLGNGQALLMMDRFCRQQDSGMKMK